MSRIDGSNHSENLYGTSGDDDIYGYGGDDILYGYGGNDYLNGGPGDDSLDGGSGDDDLVGGTGINDLWGGTGHDWFIMSQRGSAGFSDDLILDFTFGQDAIDLSAWGVSDFSQVDALLRTDDHGRAALNGFYDGYDHIVRIAGAARGDFAASDFIYSNAGAGTQTGTSYDDVLFGSRFADTLNGAGGNDVLLGGMGNDSLSGGKGDDDLIGGSGVNDLWGGSGRDLFILSPRHYGASDDRVQDFTFGDDRIDVSAWGISDFSQVQDLLRANGAGDATMDAFYGGAGHVLTIDGVAPGQLISSDLVYSDTGPLNSVGTGFNDVVLGSRSADVLRGAGGNDIVLGGGGNDILYGDAGADRVFGGTGNDALVGGAGGDSLNGGAGIDTASYGSSGAAVRVSLATGTGSGGDAAGDSLAAIENLNGSNYADTLIGDAGSNNLFGDAGADSLSGGAGDDALRGEIGNDQLVGGAGNDRFFVDIGGGQDTIFDFHHAATSGAEQDKLDLRAFHFASTADALAHAHSSAGTTYFDLDGNPATHEVTLLGLAHVDANDILI